MHFLRLRMDAHAQYEIRVYGQALARCARAVAPLAYQAFEEHVLHGRRLSRSELAMVREALDERALRAALAASGMRASRRRELLDKLGLSGAARPDVPQASAHGTAMDDGTAEAADAPTDPDPSG